MHIYIDIYRYIYIFYVLKEYWSHSNTWLYVKELHCTLWVQQYNWRAKPAGARSEYDWIWHIKVTLISSKINQWEASCDVTCTRKPHGSISKRTKQTKCLEHTLFKCCWKNLRSLLFCPTLTSNWFLVTLQVLIFKIWNQCICAPS